MKKTPLSAKMVRAMFAKCKTAAEVNEVLEMIAQTAV